MAFCGAIFEIRFWLYHLMSDWDIIYKKFLQGFQGAVFIKRAPCEFIKRSVKHEKKKR